LANYQANRTAIYRIFFVREMGEARNDTKERNRTTSFHSCGCRILNISATWPRTDTVMICFGLDRHLTVQLQA
jgi:hypothetical protein